MLPHLTATLALASIAAAAPIQQGVVDFIGEVTFVDSSAFRPDRVVVGGPVNVAIRLDLSTPPVNSGMDSLRYATLPLVSHAQLDRQQVLDSTPVIQHDLLVVNGVGVLPDAMIFEQSTSYNNGTSQTEGRAVLFLDGQASDVWTSPDLSTFPEALALGAPGGPRAFLSVYDGSDVLVATATFTTLELDVSGEAGCVGHRNSTGLHGRVRGLGSRRVDDNAFSLVADRLPQGSFGYFIASPNEAYIVAPGGQQGALCMTSPVGRFIEPGQVQNSGQSGMVTVPVDLVRFPTDIGFESILAGDTRYIQFWHRDLTTGFASSNFTNSAVITFE